MTFQIITLGCKVNSYESEMMKQKMLEKGYVYQEKLADIVIINTCSVTNMADNKSKKMIRAAKRNNPNVLAVVGCCAQNHQEALLDLGIDILLGNVEKSHIADLIETFLKTQKPYVRFYNMKKVPFEDMSLKKYEKQVRAFVKIEDGCNNYCAYCIIPYMRGNIRSKDFDQTIKEVEELVLHGHQEVVLTGIDTGSYGKESGHSLAQLIAELSKIETLKRIRLSSIEITELNDEFLHELATNPKLCHHLHVPLQAGSDHVLRLMGRKYDLNAYEEKIKQIRFLQPDIHITTDIIVGFPGETEGDFLSTLSFVKKIGFGKVHVFPYSIRKGTKAASFSDQLSNTEKKERARKLLRLSDFLEQQAKENLSGKRVLVLIEEVKQGKSYGFTNHYIKVCIDGVYPVNTFLEVIILDCNCQEVYGVEAKIANLS